MKNAKDYAEGRIDIAKIREIYFGKEYYADLLNGKAIEANFIRSLESEGISGRNYGVIVSQSMREKVAQAKATMCKPTTPLIETLATAVPPPPAEVIYSKETKGYVKNTDPISSTVGNRISTMIGESVSSEQEIATMVDDIKSLTREVKRLKHDITYTDHSISSITRHASCKVDKMHGNSNQRYNEAVLDSCVLKRELIITPAEIEKFRLMPGRYLQVNFDNAAMESWKSAQCLQALRRSKIFYRIRR